MRTISHNKGFSLIELMVVLALIVGMSATLLLQDSTGKDLARVNKATVQLESALKEAQALGNSGRAFPPGASAPDNFDRGYGVYFVKNSNTVYMYGGSGDTNNDNSILPSEEAYVVGNEYDTIIFEGGVVVSNIDYSPGPTNRALGQVLFRRGESTAKIHFNTGVFSNRDDVEITLGLNGQEKMVVVNKQGLIYSKDI